MNDREQAIEAMAAAMWIARGGVPRIWAEYLHTPPVPGSEMETVIHHIRRAATAALDALCALSREPSAAWRIVGTGCTAAMARAATERALTYEPLFYQGIYRSMLTAAPNPLEDAQ